MSIKDIHLRVVTDVHKATLQILKIKCELSMANLTRQDRNTNITI